MNDIDPNKIFLINDCKGTCKTPIGCTCGKMGDEEDNHLVQPASEITQVANPNEPAKADPKSSLAVRICSCGRNPGGLCGCSKSENAGCCKTRTSNNCCSGTHKLEIYDWMASMPSMVEESKMVEVQFKNTRKGYYLNSNDLEIYKGDVVAVEATPGHDIGEVTLTGKLVELQMRKNNYRGEVKRIYRTARMNDIEKYQEAKKKEHKTMLRAREIAEEQTLNMKISDVEYQGDGNKAIFYYIADERVDFRQLIKVYASEFRIKIEMKQIGARQEAGRVGGIGSCGRELCCSSSMSNFVSVSTSAARLQDISLNPQKLAGQCGKLKCCLNFETDVYVEAQRQLPSRETILETKDASYYHFKTDILSGIMTFSTDKHFAANLVTLPKDRVFDIIRLNKSGDRPLNLNILREAIEENSVSNDILDQDSIHRFDKDRANAKRKKKGGGQRNEEGTGGASNNNNRRNGNGKLDRPIKVSEQTKEMKEAKETKVNTGQPNAASGDRPQNNRSKQRKNNKPNNNRKPQQGEGAGAQTSAQQPRVEGTKEERRDRPNRNSGRPNRDRGNRPNRGEQSNNQGEQPTKPSNNATPPTE